MSKVSKVSFVAVVASMFLASCGLDVGGDTYNVPAVTENGVTLDATGSVKVVPDGVQFNFSVFAVEATSKSASERANVLANQAREALDESKIDKEDISTQNVSVYPEYSYSPEGKQTLIGFRASQSFAVTLRDTEEAGAVVDAVLLLVGTDLTIDTLAPILLDTSDALEQARENAIKLAKKKAEDYADLLDVELGDVISVREFSGSSSIPQPWLRDMATADSLESTKTVVDLGTQEVTVTVEVRWAFDR
ncbi:MAG: SIMPL domain-containing protein [Ilumatobacteraceae bacterium]|jgi:uncharacterized protein YggE|nr:SIMPL domain-containing protein [Ilumatobacteraceae bacterium]MBJ7422161.1 SIMPL domain-containing protein [Ilumatobacteraceae bacterium]